MRLLVTVERAQVTIRSPLPSEDNVTVWPKVLLCSGERMERCAQTRSYCISVLDVKCLCLYVQPQVKVGNISIRRFPHLHRHIEDPGSRTVNLHEYFEHPFALTRRRAETARIGGYNSFFPRWVPMVPRGMRYHNAQDS